MTRLHVAILLVGLCLPAIGSAQTTREPFLRFADDEEPYVEQSLGALGTPEALGLSRYIAVLFASQDYAPDSGLTDLVTPYADARGLAETLAGRFGFETVVVEGATRSDILRELDRLASETDDRDAVFLYFAGHGAYVEGADRSYWLPEDASSDDKDNWVSSDDVKAAMGAMRARHVALVSDSCFGGRFRGVERLPREEPVATDAGLQNVAGRPSRTVITSGANERVTDRVYRDGMGLFAYNLREALTGVPDAYVPLLDAYTQVRRGVSRKAEQVPMWSDLGEEGGELVMLNRRSCELQARRAAMTLDAQAVQAWEQEVGELRTADVAKTRAWLAEWEGPHRVPACDDTVEVYVAQDYVTRTDAWLYEEGFGPDLRRRRARRGLLVGGGVATLLGGGAILGTQLWWQGRGDGWTVGEGGVVAPTPADARQYRLLRGVNYAGIGALASGAAHDGHGHADPRDAPRGRIRGRGDHPAPGTAIGSVGGRRRAPSR